MAYINGNKIAFSSNVNITEGTTPTGEIEITENGTHDVTNYASAKVNVQSGGGTDRLQWKCDNMKSLKSEFASYKGESVDGALVGLDTSQVTDMYQTFYGCLNLISIPAIDTRNVVNMYYTFQGCKKLTTIPALDMSSVTNSTRLFDDCQALVNLPSELNTSNVTTAEGMFRACWSLTIDKIPKMDTSNMKNMDNFFQYCKSLTEIPLVDTSSATNLEGFCAYCDNLTRTPSLNTSNATSMGSFCSNSKLLVTLSAIDTSKNKRFNVFCGYCSELVTVEELDLISATTTSSMFTSCYKLTNINLKNIKISLQIGSGTSWGHLLTLDSLLNTIKELHIVTSSQTLTVGSANLEKLANVYVKLIDITDEMRAEDEYIDNKLPFEVCESTDEGALHIIDDYMTLKAWQIK